MKWNSHSVEKVALNENDDIENYWMKKKVKVKSEKYFTRILFSMKNKLNKWIISEWVYANRYQNKRKNSSVCEI